MLICLDENQKGPLGIHVLPYCDDEEQCEGLIIKEIVKGGRIDQDGRFSVGDRIIEVNDQTLLNVNFETAQSLIGDALKDNQLKLNIVKNSRKKQMNYTLPNDSNQINKLQNIPNNQNFNSNNTLTERLIDSNDAKMINKTKETINEDKFDELNISRFNNQLDQLDLINNEQSNDDFFNEVSPDDYTSDAFKRNGVFNASNTRKIGKKYHIRLVKDTNGLGFSITTRDNQVGQCPIYIKNILPVGAAKKDGNLKSGDRLLEVNGIEMTGKSHNEALKVLRDIESGQTVDLIVSRQENNLDRTSSNQSSFNNNKSVIEKQSELNTQTATNTKLPRQLPVDSNQIDLAKTREVLSFNIPLNDTGSAGLGISVKGKTSASNTTKISTDLGIFVKSVFRGGAAFKDGRLKANDQLVSINGISLLNSNNEEAMETLRRVLMNNEGINISSNSINLTVARVTDPLENPNNSLLSNSAALAKDELYDTFGSIPVNDAFHQRNLSTISTDSIKLNFYEQNYQPPLDQTDFMNQNYNQSVKSQKQNNDFNELYKLNRKSNIFNSLNSKDSLSTDSNEQFTISTPVKTSMKSDFTDNDNLNELSIKKFMDNSNRTDILIENDDQENNDPNVYRNYYFKHNNDHQLEDSLNKSKDSQMMNLSNVTNQLSLNDEEEFCFNFQRDGFGRQSMSEKRYAQLDAKNTDTFKKAKQRKLQQQQLEQSESSSSKNGKSTEPDKLKSNEEKNTFIKELTSIKANIPFDQSSLLFNTHFSNHQPTPFTLAAQQTNHLNKFNQSNYLPRQPPMNYQSNYCSNGMTNYNGCLNNGGLNNGFANYNNLDKNNLSPKFGQWLGMKKSSSLESLQTLMHEVKKENNINYNTNLPYNTLRRPNKVSRNRNVNESFKTAIDKSYEEYMDNLTMETVNEEFNESSGFSITPSTTVNQMPLTNRLTKSPLSNENNQLTNTSTNYHSKPSSTSIGTTLSNGANEITDEEVGLIRRRSTGSSKNKKTNGIGGSGILRNLFFRFGSKKFKDKDKNKQQNKLSTPQNIKKELEEEVEKIRARKAALYEQELIQEYYKRLIDQQKFQQIVSQQAQQRQQILNTPTNNGNLNNTLKKQSIQHQSVQQQQYKKQDQKKIYVIENDHHRLNINQTPTNQNLQPYLNMQSNRLQSNQLQSNHLQPPNLHSNQMLMNKQMGNFETSTSNYFQQASYGVQNRSCSLETTNSTIENQRPKSSFLSSSNFENNSILVNQNGNHLYSGGYYNDLNRKPFTNSHLNSKQQAYLKENSIQPFETIHARAQNYDPKDAIQRPGSRIAVDFQKFDDLNNYVIVVRKNSMQQNEVNRPYV